LGLAFLGALVRGTFQIQSIGFASTPYAYVGAVMLVVAAILATEALRSSGVKAKRLAVLSAAVCLFGLNFIVAAIGIWEGSFHVGVVTDRIARTLQGSALVAFFFALATPRTILARWRQGEQAAHLERTAARDPEERGLHAAEDLLAATVRGIGGAATLVALRDGREGDEATLAVRAASDPAMCGRVLNVDGGLLTAVMKTGQPFMDVPIACEPSLSALVAPHGVRVLIAPIRTETAIWGVVIAVLRRGALFPEDDLATMAQLGRNAATALDHASLIAERRAAARSAADRRLRMLEERMDLTLDSISDYAMLVLGPAGEVAAWHHGAEAIFGHRREQIVRAPAHLLYDLAPDELRARLDEARTAGSVEFEGPCRRVDGATFIGLTTVRPLVAEGGQPPGFVVVTRDVTDRRQLEDRLRQSQKMEAIGQLAGGVAHDFNNLLTAILGYADWLDHGLRNDPRRGQVTAIQKAAERAADLTRQLLAFSRRQMIQPTTLNISELVRDLVPMLRRLIGDHIEIVDATNPTCAPVVGDRSQVEQIVLNLAVNARDAMAGGGRLTFRTTDLTVEAPLAAGGLTSGAYVQLEVSDTGAGMDEATLARIFEPFFTTKDVGQGTGLGLSTVYGIVQQMEGTIDVDSTPGTGTRFQLTFPRAADTVAPLLAPGIEGMAAGSGTLLLVEDDEAVRTYLSSVLESHGYRVLAAEHAKSALDLTERFADRIDLVISDVAMPGSTGPELVELLGQARPGLPALFISGHGGPNGTPAAGDGAASSLLEKPFSSADLLMKVRQILSAA
jgi:PAS domain S-box-containing protein